MDAFTSSGNYLGTERIGRALTDAESKQLGRLLREHDFTGASMIALRFAYKLSRSREGARDLVGRTNLRLVRLGWDPNAVSLVKCLCRLVWSERMNERRETAAARRAEEAFLREEGREGERFLPAAPARAIGDPLKQPPKPPVASSPEQDVLERQEQREQDERRQARTEQLRGRLPELREAFRAGKDEVNEIWLDRRLEGTTDPATMARDSGRDVAEFYAAARRRERAVRKILEVTEEPDAGPPGREEEKE